MRLAATLIVLSFAVPATAQDYVVTGVAADDTLNIRADIFAHEQFAEAPVVTALSPDTEVHATGRSYVLNGALWREVSDGAISGWANAAFLTRSSIYPATPAFSCAGTEPFWDVNFDGTGGSANAIDMDAPLPLTTVDWSGAAGRPDVRRYDLVTDAGQEMTAIIAYTEACSDGMSDFTYAYSVFLLGLHPGALHAGCCTMN